MRDGHEGVEVSRARRLSVVYGLMVMAVLVVPGVAGAA